MFIRGGSIVPRRDRVRRSSHLMRKDPYTFIIALNSNQEASGNIYNDDGSSFKYNDGAYVHSTFNFKNNVLTSKNSIIEYISGGKNKIDESLHARIERIIITGLSKNPTTIRTGDTPIIFKSKKQGNSYIVTLKNPGVVVGEEWSLNIE
jgi:alpha 1,3-glucosidase